MKKHIYQYTLNTSKHLHPNLHSAFVFDRNIILMNKQFVYYSFYVNNIRGIQIKNVRTDESSYIKFIGYNERKIIGLLYEILSSIHRLNLPSRQVLYLNGLGFRYEINKKNITLYLNYTNPIHYTISPSMKATSLNSKSISFRYISKRDASLIHIMSTMRYPERYKGKGIYLLTGSYFIKEKIK